VARHYLISISGGKDSTALWLHMKYDLGLENLIPVFADTGWEHPLTYEYLHYLETKLGKLHRVKSDLDFVGLAVKKQRFPSARARFCTEHLKLKPCRDFIESLGLDDLVICSGVRHEESKSRSKMAERVDCDDYYKRPQWRPIITWTWQQVFAIHDKYSIEPNPLYKHGMGRVGCMPCIMANNRELKAIAERFPEVFDKVAEAEQRVSASAKRGCASFWTAGDIPERFCSKKWVQIIKGGRDKKTGRFRLPYAVEHPIPTPEDVRRYVTMDKEEKQVGHKMPLLFEEPQNEDLGVCSSIYGLCE